MMVIKNETELCHAVGIREKDGAVTITDESAFRRRIDDLVDTIILSDSDRIKQCCMWIIWEGARQLGIYPSSIRALYAQRAHDEAINYFTVPAINFRILSYLQASIVFRVAKKYNAGAFIFEIAKSEIAYTGQSPREYASVVMAAAVKEHYRGPVFIQGDHCQVNAKRYAASPEKEIDGLKQLIQETVAAGFYNIDIDSSTLVNLKEKDVSLQQKENYWACAALTKYIRAIEPPQITVSIGGEIGEVGSKNSTQEELEAFMKGFTDEKGSAEGLSKLSIQTGTTHGGVVLPDGSIAQVKLDFETLKTLSEVARKRYGLGGCVQHGASTLPREAFHKFPEAGCCEIHLATQFQNIVYEYLPIPLKERMYEWVKECCADERGEDQTEEQFLYALRKKALGPFKKEIHRLPKDLKKRISLVLEEEIDFLFVQLRVKDTRPVVDSLIRLVGVPKKKEEFLGGEKTVEDAEGAD